MKYCKLLLLRGSYRVTPYVGVWIEILTRSVETALYLVTPYVGVWIEIPAVRSACKFLEVTPYVGVWIEIIRHQTNPKKGRRSPPMWGCGLKFRTFRKGKEEAISHPLCGGVD